MLVDAGASIVVRDRWGRTPLAIAQQQGSHNNSSLLRVIANANKRREWTGVCCMSDGVRLVYRSEFIAMRSIPVFAE